MSFRALARLRLGVCAPPQGNATFLMDLRKAGSDVTTFSVLINWNKTTSTSQTLFHLIVYV